MNIHYLEINKLLNRTSEFEEMKSILKNFEKNKMNLTTKKGIYIYGDPGIGKTTFVLNVLKELDYDVIKYDAGDIRNKSIIDTITKHNMSDKNVMSLFHKKVKHIAIVMDEIDGMNSGDKGGINALIKIIRPKKTKKQKLEDITINPIICIGNYHMDKKIKELMKVCDVFELKTPNKVEMTNLINRLLPSISEPIIDEINTFIQGDLRKLFMLFDLYQTNSNILNTDIIKQIFLQKTYNDDTKKITHKLLTNKFTLNEHLTIMNETDRTIVGLLCHENIVDLLDNLDKKTSLQIYLKILNNICFADYIDRITFQKQIWQFNEMSSLIKTFKNNQIFHDFLQNNKTNKDTKKNKINTPNNIRFTKVLTKYSTEYNNSLFIQNISQQLGMDRNDLFSFFFHIQDNYLNNDCNIQNMLDNYEFTKLDINRMYRYLDKYIRQDAIGTDEVCIDCEPEIECDI